MGIRGGSVLVPWRPFFWIDAEGGSICTQLFYSFLLTGPLPGGVDVLVERKAIFER